MPDIRIVPANAIMSFTSSLNFIEKLTQDPSGSLTLFGSGSTGRTDLFSIDGNNGRLFTVSDDLSDSLFSVNTIAGLPVIEAFANNSVNIGQYTAPPIKVTGSLAIITGSLLGTASYATQALSASWAPPSTSAATASFVTSSNVYGPNGSNSILSASFASTAGNATTATSASMASLVAIATQDTTSNTYNVTFTGGTSGNHSLNVDATTLTYNPNTGIFATNRISATSVTASLQGTASYASQAATASWATNVTNNGVTSVSASGTVSGITLGGGPITSTGTLTLSGTVSGLTNSNLSGTAGITNANLATSAIQIGSTNMSLGMGYSTITGLASVTSTAFTGSFSGSHFGPLTGTASYATNALTASTAVSTPNAFTLGGSPFVGYVPYANANLTFTNSGIYYSSTNIGIGTTSIQGKFHVYQTTNLGGTAGNSLILQTLQNTGGSGGNVVLIKDYAVRDATGTAWTTWRHHNSIDIDGVYNTPGTNTRCFWERDPLSGVHYFGNSANYTLTVDGDNNRVGIGTTTPSFPLSFGTGLGNKIALYDAGSGAGYGFGIQSQLLQIFSNASGDDITFGYGNSASLTRNVTFKGTGNVGIGTTSPVTKLDVTINDNAYGSAFTVTNTNTGSAALSQLVLSTANNSTGLFQIRQFNNGGAVEMANYANASTNFWTSGSERMRIHANGKVSVNNTDSTVGQFSVSNNASVTSYNTTFRMTEGATFKNDTIVGWNVAGQHAFFGNYQSFPLALRTNDAARIWIAAGGNVGIGTTSPSYPLHVGIDVSGTSIYASADIVAYSDESVKENIRPIENVIERIQQSRGVLYDRTDIESKDNIGFIAQELEVAFPELVVTNEDGTKAVKYQNTVAVLFEAIKDQQKQIEQLKQIVNGITR